MSNLDGSIDKFVNALGKAMGADITGRIANAIKMFRKERNLLYVFRDSDGISAVIKSQTHPEELEYAVTINKDGSFFCGTQNLHPCGGLRGAICKHIILALLAIIKSQAATSKELIEWVKKTKDQKPVFLKPQANKIFANYRLALKGELVTNEKIEWRPVEMVPEDFMAF
jgi:hypothetical protein